ncbi:MAG: ATP-grasp domain-containing protein [Deltaproteobacteria bacterium]|nr:ATP-grasp domain-containing protein [Deltaproteobacteria bacterium]
MTKKRILAICPTLWDETQFHLPKLQRSYTFVSHGSYPAETPEAIEPLTFIDDTVERFADQDIEGVISTHDYPGCILAAAIAKGLGLPGADPAALLRAQHKAAAREVMQEAIPECTPRFSRIEPGSVEAPASSLPYPFFIKPAKSVTSILAQPIGDATELAAYLDLADAHATDFVRPFNRLWQRYIGKEEPNASCFVGEELLKGEQVTVEGFAFKGEVTIMGIVDSVMIPGTTSFDRFNYPSRLPESVLARIRDTTIRTVEAFTLGDCQFNVEFFYDERADALRVIELNPRMSYQFSDLFGTVDNDNSYEILCSIATGLRPTFSPGEGPFRVATSFVFRLLEDRRIAAYPSHSDVATLTEAVPELRLLLFGQIGQRLSDLPQDLQSFRYGIANLAGADEADLMGRFQKVQTMLQQTVHLEQT